MNKNRSKEIDKVCEMLAQSLSILENIRDDEQGDFDNLTESQQENEKGQDMAEAVSNLDQAVDHVQEAIDLARSAQ